uniref:Tetraspanin n=1 Tax=Strigamia maritima TaxID=126957 RepID=T1IN95_STRMM
MTKMGKRLQTVAAVTCMKSLLMVFNFAFWIITSIVSKLKIKLTGIVILAVGIWMEVELYKYMELTTNYYSAAPYILIGTGAIIILVGSLACCCTAKGQPVLLYLYSAFLIVVFVVELSAGISGYAYRGKLKTGFKRGLNESLGLYGIDRTKTEAIDMLQSQLKCCGIDTYTDWERTRWSNHTKSVPESCCEARKCHHTPRIHEEDIYTHGCYDKVVDFINGNMGTIGAAGLGIAFFQLVGVFLSCCLAKHINKAKYEQVP